MRNRAKIAILLITINKGENHMRPLQISLETAQKLSKALGMPIEQIMHMPQHILVQKLVELEKAKKDED
jgi:tRNA A37 threonylcarbamoyltransferase TsaD